MNEAGARELLASAYCGRLGTIGADGWPYVVPLLHVYRDDHIYVHNSAAHGHLRHNIEQNARVCFEVDEPGTIFGYGRFECDTSLSYASVVAFGIARIVEDRDEKSRFCTALLNKYAGHVPARPKDVFPRLDHICVYAIAIERLTGKHAALPPPSEQWPARDRTKSSG